MAGLAYNAKLYLIGGYRLNADGSQTAVRVTNIYNPATKQWTTGAPLPTARVDISASRVVLNGSRGSKWWVVLRRAITCPINPEPLSP